MKPRPVQVQVLIEGEEWRPVVGWEGLYEVSSEGRVKRVLAGQGAIAGRIRKPVPDQKGYHRLSLTRDGKHTFYTVHDLVTAAFIGPKPHGLQVNHRSGIKADNSVRNLEYVTNLENRQHAIAMGLHVDPPHRKR